MFKISYGEKYFIDKAVRRRMVSKILSAIPLGFGGEAVWVECDANRGLPGLSVVGLPNTTVNEARDRVRSAIVNSKLDFPARKITINLAPAELKKDGSGLDLPIALAILAVSGQFKLKEASEYLFVGELSLNGEICAIPGVINVVEIAKELGVKAVFVPEKNLPQARLVKGVAVRSAKTLKELVSVFGEPEARGGADDKVASLAVGDESADAVAKLATQSEAATPTGPEQAEALLNAPVIQQNSSRPRPEHARHEVLFDDIRGQAAAKRALTIAVAGRHNILLSGPPGTGKTMLARAAHSLLPPLLDDELVAVAKLHGLTSATGVISKARPFRSPHHSASLAALVGGGVKASPGEISLAHYGVLFLDELPEFPRNLVEALRQPLEDHTVTVTRVNYKLAYPADFMLIATENPCPCGYLGDPDHECACSQTQIACYRKRISGPILDRIDMVVPVERVPIREIVAKASEKNEHQLAYEQIARAREFRRQRQLADSDGGESSRKKADLAEAGASEAALNLLTQAADKLGLSMRSYAKVLKVARTIADLAQSETIEVAHVAEALQYRGRKDSVNAKAE
ncbi:MAG: YifB family Mg chelatase-like AAA ATPase [Candidatus Nomurabacteria bacterium]|nr:YifB family Mg chelatase-like AAA ATPase [Candidatus Nomurabacteria bacterium]